MISFNKNLRNPIVIYTIYISKKLSFQKQLIHCSYKQNRLLVCLLS